MSRKLVGSYILFIAASALLCCGQGGLLPELNTHGNALPEADPDPSPRPAPSTDSNTVTITLADACAVVALSEGGRVVVQLTELQDSAYEWSVADTPLGTPARSSVYLGSANGLVGAPNLVTYTWLTEKVEPGTYPLLFTQISAIPFSEKFTFVVTIVVKNS